MSKEIKFYTKNVYGNSNMYIVDEKMASIISGLTGTKTLLKSQMRLLEELGFTFEEVIAPKK